ncbi:hypothetical protein E3P98_01860 [Wallemia ichthyophaga]|nr:hypothetical protein E3P98_01860 [Wallemia ichthyophaga]
MISIEDDLDERQGRQSNPQLEPFDTFLDFDYTDDDTLPNELNEFYSYVDVRSVLDNKHEWQVGECGSWRDKPLDHRQSLIKDLLSAINADKLSERLRASRKLLYLFQGTFSEARNSRHQLECIIDNVHLIRLCGGLQSVTQALQAAVSFHAVVHSEYAHLAEPDFVEQLNIELGGYMEMLYYMVQILRDDNSFAEDLMHLDPSLPTYLFSLLSGLRDKTAKGYPVKKLLLLLWKTLLVVLGGWKDIDRIKELSYDLFSCNLATKDDNTIVKSNPVDLQQFFTQTSLKYPTYKPNAQPLPLNGLALASAPAPLKTSAPKQDLPSAFAVGPTVSGGNSSNINTAAPEAMPGTPLPTPPPSPAPGSKLKKTQFQTDQTKPFIFPFSENTSSVPTSIDEAGRLYAAHMHVPISLWQTHQIRKDFVRSLGYTNRYAEIAEAEGEKGSESNTGEDIGAPVDEFDASSIASQLHPYLHADNRVYMAKLMRIEMLYREILPYLHNCVIVLLKLLLATLNSQNTTLHHDGEHPSLSLDEMDVARHREITSKAVSAIVLLLLKWFKVSHVMKFQWLSTLLVDSNCILLMLKMYGFQDVLSMMRTQHEVEDLNFFNYCAANGKNNDNGAINSNTNTSIHPPHRKVPSINSNDGIPDFETFEKPDTRSYSWRNLFATINFMRIVQKLSKKRTHRLLLLVQYKSSAMLKRLLRISEPRLQLYVLKIIKGQVPYYGRKWRQSNMKVITAIYLNCRPELRDEWLASADVDQEIEDSLPQEQSLRAFVKFCGLYITSYNHYPQLTIHTSTPGGQTQHVDVDAAPAKERRSHSQSQSQSHSHEVSQSHEKAHEESPSHPHSDDAKADDIYDMHEYDDIMEDILGGVEGDSFDAQGLDHVLKELNLHHLEKGSDAWHKLNTFLGVDQTYEDVSDSESVVSVGDLGYRRGGEEQDENGKHGERGEPGGEDESGSQRGLNDWEHISAQTLSQLPPSPNRALKSPQNESSHLNEHPGEQDLSPPPGSPKPLPFAGGANGIGVDEVEFLYGE